MAWSNLTDNEWGPGGRGRGLSQPTVDALRSMLDEDWSEGDGPLYKKLAAGLRKCIDHGVVATGTRLPSEREVAEGLFVSRSTVVAAYGVLTDDGIVTRRQGSGTWVRGRRPGTFGDEQTLSALANDAYLSGFIEPKTAALDLTVPTPTAALKTVFSHAMPHYLGAELLREATPIGYQPRGLPSLREQIAAYLEEQGLPTSKDEIIVTSGAQQAFSLLLSLFTRPNDHVIVENPTYRGLIDALVFAHVRPLPVNVEEPDLPARITDLANAHTPRLILLTPTCNYPTGSTLPAALRRELVRVAARFSIPLIEDTVLASLSLEEAPPHLASYARPESPVVLIGSLSKVLWGGLRVGWIRAPSPMISRLARIKAVIDMGTSSVSQLAARELMTSLKDILPIQREEVRTSLALMEELLGSHISGWRWRRPKGGRSMWIRLPEGSASEFAQHALHSGVMVSSGATCAVDGGFEDYLRLPFVYPPDFIRESVRRLADAWVAYSSSSGR